MEGYREVETKSGIRKTVGQEQFGSLRALLLGNRRSETGFNKNWSLERYFNGVSSYKEAEDLAVNGYSAPVEKMVEKLKEVKTMTRKRAVVKNNVVGYAPNVPNALLGLPDSMVDMQIRRIPMKVVRIKYLSSYNCGISSEQAEKAGIKIVEAILNLEAEGYRVSVDTVSLVQSNDDPNKVAYMSVRIKNAEQPLDLRKMAYPLVHVSFHRALGFQWFKTSPKCPNLGEGLGTSYSSRNGHESAVELLKAVEHDEHAVILDIEKVLNKRNDEILKNIKQMMKG